jgi:hypothetical protein
MNPQNMAQLAQALRAQKASEIELAGLDETNKYDMQMRDTPLAKANQFGHLNPLLAMATAAKGIMGQNRVQESKGARDAARMAGVENANALPLYQEQQRVNALKLAGEQRTEDMALAANKKGAPQAWVRPDGQGLVHGYPTAGGLKTEDNVVVDLDGRVPYAQYQAGQSAKTKAGSKAQNGGYTASQMGTEMARFRKEVMPIAPVVQGLKNLDALVAAEPNPSENISGIGFGVGGSGMLGQFNRALFSGEEGQRIHAAWTQHSRL